MIEIPESVNLAGQISEAFLGQAVRHVEAAHDKHGFAWYHPDPGLYPSLLNGKALTAVNPQAGQVELVIEDMHLVLNDGTTPRYLADSDADPKKHQLLVRFADGSGFACSVRMYGGMIIYPNGITDNPYYLSARDKPSPLSEQFDIAYFMSIVEATDPRLSAKALLASEQRIPGLGNGVLQDILFNAGIHPQCKLASMDGTDMTRLFDSTKKTLANMTGLHGRDTEKDLYGQPGGYPTVLSAKSKDEPCPNCGHLIVKKAYMGGSVYFCPHCQPL